MAEHTPHFGLPLLHVGQAAKELTHNEALILIDAMLRGHVKGSVDDPASIGSVVPGDLWIVAALAQGDWSGMEGRLALATDSGWRFINPPFALRLFNEAEQCYMHYDGGWLLVPTLPVLQSSTNEDEGARALLSALLDTLDAQGIVSLAN